MKEKAKNRIKQCAMALREYCKSGRIYLALAICIAIFTIAIAVCKTNSHQYCSTCQVECASTYCPTCGTKTTSLPKCSDCQKPVSPNATYCPNCGEPQTKD